MAKTAALALRIEPSLKEALQALSQADKRSLAAYVELILEAHVAKKVGGKKHVAAKEASPPVSSKGARR